MGDSCNELHSLFGNLLHPVRTNHKEDDGCAKQQFRRETKQEISPVLTLESGSKRHTAMCDLQLPNSLS